MNRRKIVTVCGAEKQLYFLIRGNCLIYASTEGGDRGYRGSNGGVAVVELRSGIWYNMHHETVAQLQDQSVLSSDRSHCPPRVLPG